MAGPCVNAGRLAGREPATGPVDAALLLLGAMCAALVLLGLRAPDLFEVPDDGPAPPPVVSAPERRLLDALDARMVRDRAYRDPALTIGGIAARLGISEHAARRLINGALGHRNVNDFLNGFRIAEVRAALADPAQRDVPILVVALDAGFGSLGAFNRAFREREGRTPSEFRRGALTGHGGGVGGP